jgi:HTH-type transcriptional regulator/antitoxin HigA
MALHIPAHAIHPGEILAMELEARGWTHEDLAAVTRISRRQIINLIHGKSGITPDTALALADAFGEGHEAIGWMNAQAVFELALAAQKDRDVAKRAEIFNLVPVRELMRRGWIVETKDTRELEESVCALLRCNKLSDPANMAVAARKSTSYETETGAQLAWYGRVLQRAEGAPVSAYSPAKIDDGISELRKLAAFPEDTAQVPHALADMGIRLVFVQVLRSTKIDGVATWLDEDRTSSPVIGMSLRYDRIDNFWFTLLHELMHIRHGDMSPIDVDTLSIQRQSDLPDFEIRANNEAAETLIPRTKLESFIGRHKPFYYETTVVKFAQARGVHPGIVVGQLQNHAKSEFDFKQLRKQLVHVREFLLGNAITDGWKFKPSA